MSDTSNEERRHFQRIATDKQVVITHDGTELHGTVLDISLHGLLFETDVAWNVDSGAAVRAHVVLNDETCCIDMEGEVAHVEAQRVGLKCVSIDLDSASNLRRLVELNLADDALLKRELAELVANQD